MKINVNDVIRRAGSPAGDMFQRPELHQFLADHTGEHVRCRGTLSLIDRDHQNFPAGDIASTSTQTLPPSQHLSGGRCAIVSFWANIERHEVRGSFSGWHHRALSGELMIKYVGAYPAEICLEMHSQIFAVKYSSHRRFDEDLTTNICLFLSPVGAI